MHHLCQSAYRRHSVFRLTVYPDNDASSERWIYGRLTMILNWHRDCNARAVFCLCCAAPWAADRA